MIQHQLLARTNGWAILLMAIIAGYAYGYAFPGFYVPGEANATFIKYGFSPDLYSQFVTGFILILLLDFLLSYSLYVYFQPLNRAMSLLLGMSRAIYSLLLAYAISFLLPCLFGPFTPQQLLGGVVSFLDAWSMALIVFGIHLLILSWLMRRSPHIPRWLAWLCFLSGLGYLSTNTLEQVWPVYIHYKSNVEKVLSLPMAAGELGFAIWSLIWGWRGPVTSDANVSANG